MLFWMVLSWLMACSESLAEGRGAPSCSSDADCGAQEDGDLCNGTLYCDESSGACKVNPATVVVCPFGMDTECLTNTCHPRSGECGLQRQAPDTPCDDGDVCTHDDVCGRSGTCAGVWDPDDYNNRLSTCQCTQLADCEAYEDGNLCNGTLFCLIETHECVVNPKTVVSCPSVGDTACKSNECLPETGACEVLPKPELTPCDDGEACTGYGKGVSRPVMTDFDHCIQGECESGPFLCECASDADCEALDTDLCQKDFCDQSTGSCEPNPSKAVICPSGQTCEPATGTCD
jgi:hypothetical protein